MRVSRCSATCVPCGSTFTTARTCATRNCVQWKAILSSFSEERAPILGPRNIVSRVRPGTKGKEKEKEGRREREREREEKKNESIQAGRMERREPFDTTRSATKRTCCGRITVHIYIYISTFFESSPLFLPAHSRAPVFHDPRIVIEYRIVRRRRFSNS